MLRLLCCRCRREHEYAVENLVGWFFFCKSCWYVNMLTPSLVPSHFATALPAEPETISPSPEEARGDRFEAA